MELTQKQKIQPYIGLALLLVTIIFGVFKGMNDQFLALYLMTGVILGYILTRSRYGFAGGFKRIYVTGEGSLSKSLLVMFAISMFLAAGLQWSALQMGIDQPGLSSLKFLNISTLLGGFFFGVGMILAGGCASGTLSDLGEGEARSWIALITFVFGSIPGLMAQNALNNTALGKIGIELYLPDVLGYVGALVVSVLLLFILYMIVRKYEDFRKKEGSYTATVYEDEEMPIKDEVPFKLFSYPTFHKLFVQRWSFMTGGILLAIMFGFILITARHSWYVTGPLTTWGIAFLQMFGVQFTAPYFETNVMAANNGILNDPGSLRNIGIILGAAIAFLLAGRWTFNRGFKFKDSLYYLLGGFLMGFGARLAGGCNIGALLSGIGNFSLSGWGFFFTLWLGSLFALKVFAGKVDVLPPNRHKN
ncbi:YeeE/YedE family protein [Eubacteriaceae bacterium ES2]|nr:YeeE/YedE family protein [Eubacteriaceae bacterium ES2]